MHIGDGTNTSDTNDFNLLPRENLVRLINFLFAVKYAGNQVSPLGRIARWFVAHQREYPATTTNVRWSSLDALKTSLGYYGPFVSESDLVAAISALPAAEGFGAQNWEVWERFISSQPETLDYTDSRIIP